MPTARIPDLVIDVSEDNQDSNILGGHQFSWADSIVIHGNVAATTGTINVEVAAVDPSAAVDADFRTLQSGGSDVTVTQDDTTVIQNTGFRSLRLHSTMAEAADRTFPVTIHEPASAYNKHS